LAERKSENENDSFKKLRNLFYNYQKISLTNISEMNASFKTPIIKNASILVFVFLAFNVSAQNTFKVVCDKTDNTVKVVQTDNRSPNFIPIKGGFPFRQIAEKWIDENMNTRTCKPTDLLNEINNEKEEQVPVKDSKQPQVQNPSNSPSPLIQQAINAHSNQPLYKNSSVFVNAKFSNLGNFFSFDKNITPGLSLGFEQLFGKKNYLGIGLDLNFYLVDFKGQYDYNENNLFFAKVPVFFGQRIYQKKILFIYEVGMGINTKIVGLQEELEIPGKTFKDNSFDILARFRMGTENIQFLMGTEMWISKITEEDDFNMTAIHMGVIFSF